MSLVGEDSVFISIPTLSRFYLRLAVFLVTIGAGQGYIYECGGFIGMSASSTGTIQSPGYPGNYPNYTRCIWIFEAPDYYVTQLTVTFQGEMYNSACSDYVEFRDGGQTGALILTNCATMTSQVVSSTGRWMYVYFASDGFSQVDGLSATYSASYVGSSVNSSISNPIVSCRSYEFECNNKLCLSLSYRCDGYNDCGCGTDCDEDACGGLSLDASERKAIGFCVGIVVFLVAAGAGAILDKDHHWQKRMDQQARERAARRQGWTSTNRDNRPKTGNKAQSNEPPSPRITSCIKISEIP